MIESARRSTRTAPTCSLHKLNAYKEDLSTAQVQPLAELSETHRAIADYYDVPRRLTEVMAALGATKRGHFKKHNLDPLIRTGVVTAPHPNRPNRQNQAYALAEASKVLSAHHVEGD